MQMRQGLNKMLVQNKEFLPGDVVDAILSEQSSEKDEIRANEIVVVVQSPDAIELTLVDIPGLQEKHCKDSEVISNLAEKYLSNVNTTIIAVTTVGGEDDSDAWTTSSAIAMANKHDPDYTRTVCVFTKPDCVSEGFDPRSVVDTCNGARLASLSKGRARPNEI